MILIIAEDEIEGMSANIYKNIIELGHNATLVQQSTLPYINNITIFPKNGKIKGSIYIDNEEIDITKIKAVYVRMHNSNFLDANIKKQTQIQIENERQVCFNTILEHLDAMVINKSKSQFYNFSKLYQSWIIKKYGFNIPNSIITNDQNELEKFIKTYQKSGIIYKSASSERSRVERFKKSDYKKLELIKNCPHLFQECVEGTDIRVHTLATGETFACKIQTQTNDYRYDKERNIIICEIPDEIKKACLQMTLDMGLYLSGIDLRRTPDGQYYCFEVNPSPAFYWYESQTGLPISRAVAKMMINANKYKKLAKRKY